MPKRIQMSRKHPWRAEHPDAVIVARSGAWGNQFHVGGHYVRIDGIPTPTKFPARHPDAQMIPDRTAAVSLFREYLDATEIVRTTAARVLRGVDLACWCPLDQPCHADVLLELANGAGE